MDRSWLHSSGQEEIINSDSSKHSLSCSFPSARSDFSLKLMRHCLAVQPMKKAQKAIVQWETRLPGQALNILFQERMERGHGQVTATQPGWRMSWGLSAFLYSSSNWATSPPSVCFSILKGLEPRIPEVSTDSPWRGKASGNPQQTVSFSLLSRCAPGQGSSVTAPPGAKGGEDVVGM